MSDRLEELCEKHKVARLYPFLVETALPAVLIRRASAAAADAPGPVSRIGGRPDLPPGFDWPQNKGRRLDFLVQIDLAAASTHDRTGLLPTSGRLAFFYDIDEQPWGFDPQDKAAFAVYYFGPDVVLEPVDGPKSEYAPAELALAFSSGLTLPHPGSIAHDRFVAACKPTKKEVRRYPDAAEGIEADLHGVDINAQHRLLGHASNIQETDMQAEAQLVSHGIYCGDSRCRDDPRVEQLEADAEAWVLLLQISSDEDADMMWGDCGRLYFWIRQEDLRRCVFDNVWMLLQCS